MIILMLLKLVGEDGDVDEVDHEVADDEDGEQYPLPVMEVDEADEGRLLALVVPPVGDVTLNRKWISTTCWIAGCLRGRPRRKAISTT